MQKYLYTVIGIFFLMVSNGQEMFFEKLQSGAVEGSCTSTTDCDNGELCYALKYIPNTSGVLTSYTTGFLASCVGSSNPLLSNESCMMSDNSDVIDGCGAATPLILINSSGNSGNTEIESGVEVILHMICFSMNAGDEIVVTEEEITDLSTSIDPEGGGDPISEFPNFTETTINFDVECVSCEDMDLCNIDFGINGGLIFDYLSGVVIRNGESITNSESIQKSFDVYNEFTFDCQTGGGQNDITFEIEILNTADVNGNGLINPLAGQNHKIEQLSDGLSGQLTHAQVPGESSSSGDIRGYRIEFSFANHVTVLANQLTVLMESSNSSASVFESAAIVFKGQNQQSLGSADYLGYFNAVNDLSGGCGSTPAMTAWDKSASGVFTMEDISTVNLTDPCNPSDGSQGTFNNKNVHAMTDAGLSGNTEIGGFILTVYSEDVASPDELDDGSGSMPDDGIVANAETNTNDLVASKLLGIEIEGCISFSVVLPIELSYFTGNPINDQLVRLEWKSFLEQSSKLFEIEWSLDGKSFAKIGETQAMGTGTEYSFDHKKPVQGSNYYRLKMEDYNGYFEYSAVVSVDFDAPQSAVIYPNPCDTNLFIQSHGITRIEILNQNGHSVMSKSFDSEDDVTLDLEDINQGYYILKIKTKDHEQVNGFVKI